jgi:hypothetical protein
LFCTAEYYSVISPIAFQTTAVTHKLMKCDRKGTGTKFVYEKKTSDAKLDNFQEPETQENKYICYLKTYEFWK